MTEGIYDEAEYQKALAWAKEKCHIGFDKNPEHLQKSQEEKEKQFEFVVKMAVIIKDLMQGQQELPGGALRGSNRPQRDRSRIPGTETVDRLLSERRLRRGNAQLFIRLGRSTRAVHPCYNASARLSWNCCS